jgi:hypothetical protein
MRVTINSNGIAKTIDNMVNIVKDRICEQTIDIEYINMICMFFCGSVNETLAT